MADTETDLKTKSGAAAPDLAALIQEQKTLTAEIANLQGRINTTLKYVQTANIKEAADLVRELHTKQARLTAIRNAARLQRDTEILPRINPAEPPGKT